MSCVRVSQPVQPLARLSVELRESAIANLVLGDAVLLVAAARSDHPGREVVWFAVVNIALTLIWNRFGPSGKLRKEAPRAAAVPADAVVAGRSAIRRQLMKGLAPVAIVLVVLVVMAPESAAVLAGVPAGVGAADLWLLGWLRTYEAERRDELFRETSSSPFVAERRPVYMRPMNEDTAET